MRAIVSSRFRTLVILLLAVLAGWPSASEAQGVGVPQDVDLAGLARRGALRADSRQVSELVDGAYRGVRVSSALNFDVVWIDGITFTTGTIKLDIRGKDVQSQSFLGLRFQRRERLNLRIGVPASFQFPNGRCPPENPRDSIRIDAFPSVGEAEERVSGGLRESR